MSSGVVHQNIDVRKRKIIFWACLVFIGVFGLTEPAFKLREKPFSKKRDHPVESRYPPVWLWGRAYFPLCYYGAGRQASECDPHQPVCELRSL